MILEEPDFETATLRLRPYQQVCVDNVDQGWSRCSRQLVVHATGTGKGSLAAYWANECAKRGKRMLFLAHRESLVRQTAERIRSQVDIQAEIEMADEYASHSAKCVCASVQSLANVSRLSGFNEDHFDLVIADEGHHSLAATWQRVMNYFSFGPKTLDENWAMKPAGEEISIARIIGLTATPDLASKRNLGEWYQSPTGDDRPTHEYSLLDGINDGWLVRPVAKSIPLNVDLRGLAARRTTHGSDFSDAELTERMEPIIEALAEQAALLVKDRKTVAFLPSVRCAELLADAVSECGLNGMLVHGAMDDSMDQLARFTAAPNGTLIANASLITEGIDIANISAVLMGRATKSRGFYAQAAGRAARPSVVGGIDQYETADERKAAIAASAKPDFLILDPLWVSDRLKLIRPCSLVARRLQNEEALASTEGDLVAAEAEAERDFLAALSKEAKKHKHKAAVTFDPLVKDLSLGEDSLRDYKPQHAWELKPVETGEREFLEKNGISTVSIRCSGQAQKVIDTIIQRDRLGLASAKQIQLLLRIGIPEERAMLATKKQAGFLIGRKFS